MRFDIVTIFPRMIDAGLAEGIISRGIAGGLLDVAVHDLRDFTTDRHRSVDDMPYGGGTFGPTRISERGRRFFARLLGELTDTQLTELFASARFDQARTPFTTTSPVSEWVRVFKQRVQAISEGPPCPDV